jgi:hypothetical protein
LIVVQFKAVHQTNCIIKGKNNHLQRNKEYHFIQGLRMDKFQKLSQLSKEIQILETAGKIKAAEVLHKKFIKESQYMMPQMMPMMMMPQMMPQMMMARPTPTVAPAAVARPVVTQAPTSAPKPIVTPTPVQQGQQSQTGQTGQVTPPAQSATPPATQPPVVNPPVTTPPPMPIDKVKRPYEDGQSKNEELQYLDKEKRRLEELGYNDPKSPFFQQYLTIIGMINRNKGGSIIKQSNTINRLKKLAAINLDIELLENAGKFKAAEILQKKFIREAQSLTPKRDTGAYGPYKKVFDKYFNLASATPSQNLITTIRNDGFLLKEDQDQLISYVNERLKSLTPIPTTAPAAPPTNAPAAPSTSTNQPTVTPTTTTEIVELANLTPMKSKPQQPQQEQQLADPSQNLFNKLLNEAKYYLSINDFNNAAIIREQASESSYLTPKQKNAWQQEYTNLVQNYSGMADTNQYGIEDQAEQNILDAAKDIGIEIINPQTIANREKEIKEKLILKGIKDRETHRLLRQISLSGYLNTQ